MSTSWSGEPHQLIARVAQTMLTKKQRKWIDEMLFLWPSEAQDLITVSNWEDTIRSDIDDILMQWHFENKPYIEPEYTPKKVTRTFNITNAIDDAMKSILDPTTTSFWTFGFYFRALIHFVGDSHCPVHSIAYYSDKYPKGDAGGNFIKLNCSISYFCSTLHKLWDSACLNFQHNKYVAPTLEDFEKNITRMMNAYPLKILEEHPSLSPHDWIDESYKTAIDYAYTPLVDWKNINDTYLANGAEAAEYRITLAGYRLGMVFKQFFKERGYPKLPTEASYSTEILAWILDAVVITITIIYSILILKEKGFGKPAVFD
ncbi:class I nuclease, putative [Trichomonas vaginalis G3]|uniref:Class I nuclease, putative n=1 Tax=Trichomonas vaginalis (strain ATCC PRA-98 / G3) TaxID=412133 RepID=A2ELH6_TRIV3|nr:S1-P1 nuclease family [Trichomonas vaginalis G3]EAY06503.1 class I nuclease, putative [Trichomonas vaginalis G3]KAI5538862.1 S1-P1 nuclease family [Trichomonas vaginalis G3]|eukprot:XP_001318726.1 class I nuclease [Trichomonas vaginalis G3]